jgi:NTP pyrophosphatase (non-canonical NTP hydrolase)
MTKTIAEYQAEIGEWARAKGWWDDERNPHTLFALIVCELSEAFEIWRDNHSVYEVFEVDSKPDVETVVSTIIRMREKGIALTTGDVILELKKEGHIESKPEGVPIDIADAVIRIIEATAYHEINLDRALKEFLFDYNNDRKTLSEWSDRAHDFGVYYLVENPDEEGEGGPDKDFGEQFMMIANQITSGWGELRSSQPIAYARLLTAFLALARHLELDIEELIEIKMAYNQNRPYRHGGKRV